ncbi:SlyX family protein [Candidatus Regiella insecticola]|uniref:Protein SlyX n=1 Tax=Candidatus Regiella insecticola TaxID=138073 RepID=A0A6L2ZQT1_9ENTR|nr:SlyX family protein [Candidatus Regiella insecticola]GFN47126.1 protein SlyX [Candidatus Regiella insecticola]
MKPLSFEERLEKLESQIAFQDKSIEELELIVTENRNTIDKLQKQLHLLGERLQETSILAAVSEEGPPPHY